MEIHACCGDQGNAVPQSFKGCDAEILGISWKNKIVAVKEGGIFVLSEEKTGRRKPASEIPVVQGRIDQPAHVFIDRAAQSKEDVCGTGGQTTKSFQEDIDSLLPGDARQEQQQDSVFRDSVTFPEMTCRPRLWNSLHIYGERLNE